MDQHSEDDVRCLQYSPACYLVMRSIRCTVISSIKLISHHPKYVAVILLFLGVFCGLEFTAPVSACAHTQASTDIFTTTLAELGYGSRILMGPSSTTQYYFNLPHNWVPQQGSYLELSLTYDFAGQLDKAFALVEVQLNDNLLYTREIMTPTTLLLQLDLSEDKLYKPEVGNLNKLHIKFEAYVACELAAQASLRINNSSAWHINYAERAWEPDLSFYPQPFYYPMPLLPQHAYFVLPEIPKLADLQASMLVAAQLGALTDGQLSITATTVPSDVLSTAIQQEHLIVIGQPQNNTLIQQLELPLPLVDRQLVLHSEIPYVIDHEKVFTLSLTVKNTTPLTKSLTVEESLPVGTTLVACERRCEEVSPGVVHWAIGELRAGEAVSTHLQLFLDPEVFSPGERFEATANLLDADGISVNVDTVFAEVGLVKADLFSTASAEKSPYFFAYEERGIAEEDGIIQALVSPWDERRMILVVTGLTEQAVLKAGYTLGSRNKYPGISGDYAIVQALSERPQMVTLLPENIAFSQLGYGHRTLTITDDNIRYYFQIPYGWELNPDASLAFHFAHSVALDALSSTVQIYLNGVPIHSLMLDQYGAGDVWYTVPFPKDQLRFGSNYLSFRLSGNFWRCMEGKFLSSIWLTIFEDSFLHLPHAEVVPQFSLNDLPYPLADASDLSDIIWVLPKEILDLELSGLLRLIFWLANATQSEYFEIPKLTLGEEADDVTLTGQHVIALGRPTKNAYITAVNDALPQPFIPGTNQIRQQVDHVIYRLSPNRSLGYIQLLPLPWDPAHIMLIVTGSTQEGVAWALDAINNQTLANRLAGNLAVLADRENLSVIDTREEQPEGVENLYDELIAVMTPEATTTSLPTPTPMPTPTPTLLSPHTPIPTRTLSPTMPSEENLRRQPVWLIPLLVVSLVTLLLASAIYVLRQIIV